jgi:hypothetical protein
MGPLGMSATQWPIVPAPGDYDDGAFGGMKTGRGNRSTRRKPAPAPLRPPQIPLDHTRALYVQRKSLRYPLNTRLGEVNPRAAQTRSFPLPHISHYTDWAITEVIQPNSYIKSSETLVDILPHRYYIFTLCHVSMLVSLMYLPIAQSRVAFEKLVVVQLANKFPSLYSNRRFITWDEVLTVVTVGSNGFWEVTP